MGCIACQPILNTKGRIFGYELLYRSSPDSTQYDAADGDAATRELLATAFGDIGIKKITGGHRSFVNFPAHLLQEDIPLLYSKDILVVEVLESVKPTVENIQALQRLKQRGYMVALDDFSFPAGYEEMVRLSNIIKIDFLDYPNRNDLEGLIRKIRQIGDKVLLAEKVETQEDFEIARDLGFSLFQGFFFSKPKLHSGLHLSPMEMSRLQLLRCLRDEELDFREIAEIIKRDVVLTHKLLRIVNSANYGLSFFVSSILHALTILGTSGTRKWISFAILQDCAGKNEQELSRMALTRGLFMERIAIPLKRKREKETFFLFGLFSMADALMKAPIEEVLSHTNLSAKVKEPLMSGEGDLAELLNLVISYERADWLKADEIAKKFGINQNLLAKYYLEAMEEAVDLL